MPGLVHERHRKEGAQLQVDVVRLHSSVLHVHAEGMVLGLEWKLSLRRLLSVEDPDDVEHAESAGSPGLAKLDILGKRVERLRLVALLDALHQVLKAGDVVQGLRRGAEQVGPPAPQLRRDPRGRDDVLLDDGLDDVAQVKLNERARAPSLLHPLAVHLQAQRVAQRAQDAGLGDGVEHHLADLLVNLALLLVQEVAASCPELRLGRQVHLRRVVGLRDRELVLGDLLDLGVSEQWVFHEVSLQPRLQLQPQPVVVAELVEGAGDEAFPPGARHRCYILDAHPAKLLTHGGTWQLPRRGA
mmetsp:Transcript_47481/g.146243  ORF Transcript_47481/g.146243 Transcript_47481/m.146243 type:complete len:300 (+) Transcript_47481:423-1322(+)